MGTTTKYRTLGARLIPKLGGVWFNVWMNSAASQTPNLPGGQTFATLAAHAAAQGVGIVTIRWGAGDQSSFVPLGEIRPDEFNWGGPGVITRNGNGDVTSALYDSTQTAPALSNMKQIFDVCYDNGIGICFQLGRWAQLSDHWNYHAYKLNRLNAADNVEALGIAGVLNNANEMWDNATAISWYQNRVDAFLNSFGDHAALHSIDLGNEFMFTSDEADFQDWIETQSDYIWSQYGTRTPLITISTADNQVADSENLAFGRLGGGARMVTWHNYSVHFTLDQKKTYMQDLIDDYNTYSFAPTYPGELRKFYYRIGENWGWKAGPDNVPDTEIDINIQGDPVLHTLAYDLFNPFRDVADEIDPYPHTRMWAFLAMALDPTLHYTRWLNFIDGVTGLTATMMRIVEVLRTAKDFYDTAVFHDTDMVRHDSNVSSSGVLDFKAALSLPNVCLTFVLVGSGNQTIDFGISGTWTMVTYQWESDRSEDSIRIVDEVNVDVSAVVIPFGDYTDGFCPGYLIRDTELRKVVRTTITTTVDVQVDVQVGACN